MVILGKKTNPRKSILLLPILLSLAQSIYLARSGLQSKVLDSPGGPLVNATVIGITWQDPVPQAPGAVSIWDGQWDQPGCLTNIIATHGFVSPCLHADLTVIIKATSTFTFTLNTFFGEQLEPYIKRYTVPTANVPCGTNLNLTINVTKAQDCDYGAEASLIYAVVTPNCMPTDTGSYYDSTTCMTYTCGTNMTGCQNCTSATVCTQVTNSTYFIYSNGSIGLCSAAISGCSKCSAQNWCFECIGNEYLIASTSTESICQPCSHYISDCLNCVDNATCIQCNEGFLIDASVCIACSNFMEGCSTCTSASYCTTVVSDNYTILSGGTTALCNIQISYCYRCSSETVCVECEAGYQLQVDNTCQPSSSSCMLFGCVTCATPTQCLYCDNPNNYFLVDGLCESCLLADCQLCLSLTECAVCNNGYVLNGLSQCVCEAGTYADKGTGTCENCILPCETCTGTAWDCLTCKNPFVVPPNTPVGSTAACVCPEGQYKSSGNCLSCDSACSECFGSSINQCNDCNPLYTLNGNSCECIQRAYLQPATSTCTACHYSCLTCNGTTRYHCKSCDHLNFRTFNVNSCPCDAAYTDPGVAECVSFVSPCPSGYYFQPLTYSCLETCGDGILISAECDDANLIDGDGCSSSCTIEENYTCLSGSPSICTYNPPSSGCTSDSCPANYTCVNGVCSLSQPISLKLVDTVKDPLSNKVNFHFVLSPVISQLNTIEYLPLLSCDLPNVTLEASYDGNGNLQVIATYASSIQGANTTILFSPFASGVKVFFSTPNSSHSFIVYPTNNLVAQVYDDATYINARNLETVSMVLMGLALGGFVAGLLTTGKFIGVEMLGVVQAAFIGLMVIAQMDPTLASLEKISFVNGVNTMYSDNKKMLLSDGTIASNETPFRIGALEYGSQVAYSFNYTLILLLLPPLVALSMFIASKIIKVQEKKDKLAAWSWLALCEFGITAVFFVMYHFVTSLAIFAGYCRTSSELFPVSIVEVVIVLLVSIPILVLFKTHPQHFGDYKIAFKEGTFNQMHYWLIAFARIILAVILVALNSLSAVGFIAMGIALAFGTYVAVKQPYVTKSNNVRAASNQAVLAIILALYGYCRVSESAPSFVAFVTIALLFIVVIGNIVMIFKYHFYDKKQIQQAKQMQAQQKRIKLQNEENFQFMQEMRKRLTSFAVKGSQPKLSKRHQINAKKFVPQKHEDLNQSDLSRNYVSIKQQIEDKISDKLLVPRVKHTNIKDVSFTKEEAEEIGQRFDEI